MLQQVGWFVGATAADAAVNQVPFSLQTALSMNGPLGATIGSLGGFLLGLELTKNMDPTDPAKLYYVLAGSAIGGVAVVMYSGGTFQTAMAMSVGGAVVSHLLAPRLFYPLQPPSP